MIQSFGGKRVTVMGLGRFGGGVGVTRWLARQGARVLVTDRLSADRLSASLAQLAGLDVELRLGGHHEDDFRHADLVVVNPAVPDSSPFLQAAREAGVPISTEINLFVERCRARCIGITGSVGKSTTSAMIAHLLEKTTNPARHRIFFGGNIGRCLLDELPQIRPQDLVVLELSSFQLQRTPAVRWSPHVAVITNITPNHLDWHGSFVEYVAAKLNIVRFQDPARDQLVCGDTPELCEYLVRLRGDLSSLWRYRLEEDEPVAVCRSAPGCGPDDCKLRWPGLKLEVPGRHNRLNAAAALVVGHLLGVRPDQAVAALESFKALPDRLECVGTIAGVRFYNDSKATTPEAAITAINSIDTPLLVILGGYDKGIDLSEVVAAAARRARFCACIGQTGQKLTELIRNAGGEAEYCGDLATAVAECRRRARPGDTILLSPACASWDQFDDYRQRGALFTELVKEMAHAG
jgi:UDP-N-acetylmuramoylalanine--D-glutamate ligase